MTQKNIYKKLSSSEKTYLCCFLRPPKSTYLYTFFFNNLLHFECSLNLIEREIVFVQLGGEIVEETCRLR